jgi:hypothetical protein
LRDFAGIRYGVLDLIHELHETLIDIEQRPRIPLRLASHTNPKSLYCIGKPLPNRIGQSSVYGLLLGLLQQSGQALTDVEYRFWR